MHMTVSLETSVSLDSLLDLHIGYCCKQLKDAIYPMSLSLRSSPQLGQDNVALVQRRGGEFQVSQSSSLGFPRTV